MGNIVITVNNKADLELLEALVKRLGLETFELSEQEMRLLSRRRLMDSVSKIPGGDFSDSDIEAEVESVRTARYVRQGH
jgi:hypothetical protein